MGGELSSVAAARRLVIEALSLTSRWSVTDPDRQAHSQWPPSVDTLYSALVAAAAGLGEARDPALLWLERRPPPAIECEPEPGRTDGVLTYAPVADVPVLLPKARQERRHSSTGSDHPVRWSWALGEDEEAPLERLSAIVGAIGYIGSSRGPVFARLAVERTPLPAHALVPTEGGSRHIRVIHEGRFKVLERAFQGGRRPPLGPVSAYAPLGETVPTTDGRRRMGRSVSAWGSMLTLRRVGGISLTLETTVSVAEAMRGALLAHLPADARPELTGHHPDAAAPHLAIIPLARAGDDHAQGEILGVGLLPPAELDEDASDMLLAALAEWLRDGGRLRIGPVEWRMGAVTQARTPWALSPQRYERASREWVSLTPVVLDRHTKRRDDGSFRAGRSTPEIVRAMCRATGLPEPEHVAEATAPLRGTAPARAHGLGRRHYLRAAQVVHLRLRFAEPVPGPLLMGRGRYFGLGVLVPDGDGGSDRGSDSHDVVLAETGEMP